MQEEREDGVVATVYKPKYLKKFQKRVEYKYAFGQRIPVDFEWRVRQRQGLEVSRQKYNKKDQIDVQYDYNGRRVKKAKQSGDECQPEEEDCEDEEGQIENGGEEGEQQEQIVDNHSEEVESGKGQERPEDVEGAGGFVLPDWIKNPFKSRSPSRSASHDDNNSQFEHQSNQEKDDVKASEPLIKQRTVQSGLRPQICRQKTKGLSKEKRKQRDLIIKSKGKGAS